jgi:hypothetical protein
VVKNNGKRPAFMMVNSVQPFVYIDKKQDIMISSPPLPAVLGDSKAILPSAEL